MLKYVDTAVTFSEIPDEVTLCINISNCPCHCKGCHSSYLAEDIGEHLGMNTVLDLCNKNKGITCIAFMGGDSQPEYVNFLAYTIKSTKPELKTAWYSGRQELSPFIDIRNFDYIKLGPYIEDLGPLSNPNSNQKFYRVSEDLNLIDETYKFKK